MRGPAGSVSGVGVGVAAGVGGGVGVEVGVGSALGNGVGVGSSPHATAASMSPEDCPELNDEVSRFYEAKKPAEGCHRVLQLRLGGAPSDLSHRRGGASQALQAVPPGFLRSTMEPRRNRRGSMVVWSARHSADSSSYS